MRSSTSVFRNLLLGSVLAAIPAGVGWAVLPPGDPAGTMPPPPSTPFDTVAPDTELVILGNSKAASDIDVPTLKAALGRPDLKVKLISIGSATMPIYYAVIKNCVLGAGARPEAVVVYATRVEMLAATLSADRRRKLLWTHLSHDEPVIARKIYGRSSGWEALRDRAVAARDGTLNTLADTVATALTGEPGRATVDASFTTVFGASWAVRRPVDLQAAPTGGYPSESPMGTSIEDSFILETEELVKGTGVKLIYALSPVSGVVREREERRLRGLEPVVATIKEHADGWIVLPQPADGPTTWQDPEHLMPQAAIPNTMALGRGLTAMGIGAR